MDYGTDQSGNGHAGSPGIGAVRRISTVPRVSTVIVAIIATVGAVVSAMIATVEILGSGQVVRWWRHLGDG